ncbi:hypothetical protein GOBAR_DD16418 [Gossypium barbadense]|nr:hypothetical protein GOBAR_DD16418 [Gossypium barbadense]
MGGNGEEILMLEAPPETARPWASASNSPKFWTLLASESLIILSAYFVVYVHVLTIFFLFLPLLLSRMQKLAQQQNEKIEIVNRERKFHQQNSAYELNALSTQWKELCLKNIEIHAACSHIEKHIAELRREAAERGWNLEANLENGALSPST